MNNDLNDIHKKYKKLERRNDMRLRPVESLVYITLLSIAREKARNLKEPAGVTVSELSKRLKKSDSAVRAILNSLKEKGLIDAKSGGVYSSLFGLKKTREKIWLPKHELCDNEIMRILSEHPEIMEHIGPEKVKELLGIEFNDARFYHPVIETAGSLYGLRGQTELNQTSEVSEVDEIVIDKIIDETFEELRKKIDDLLDERPELEGLIKAFAMDVIERYKKTRNIKYHNI